MTLQREASGRPQTSQCPGRNLPGYLAVPYPILSYLDHRESVTGPGALKKFGTLAIPLGVQVVASARMSKIGVLEFCYQGLLKLRLPPAVSRSARLPWALRVFKFGGPKLCTPSQS